MVLSVRPRAATRVGTLDCVERLQLGEVVTAANRPE